MALMKKLTSAIVASSLVLGLVGTAFAGYTGETAKTGAERMQALGLVKGYADGTLGLDKNITRAEFATIMVRAFGKADLAALLKTSVPFPDVKGHWAAGEIALAQSIIQQNGGSMGLPDGTFNPNGNVTAAEAVAFLAKFLGVQPTTAAWPQNYLQAAVNAGIITADDEKLIEPQASAAATRGLVFYLADGTFAGYKLSTGKTVYTTFADAVLPTITLTNAAVATTNDAKVTVSGTASDDKGFVAVFVGSTPVTLTNGQFTADVNVNMGDNNITVSAYDKAGNVATQTIKVTRAAGAAATVEGTALTVAAGASVDLGATVKDAKGNVIANAVVTGTSDLGTVADGKFTAGTKAGTGTVALKSGDATGSVNVTVTAGDLAQVSASATSVKKGDRVTLTAQDQYGNAVSGATFTSDNVNGIIDNATGVFVGTDLGTYTVTAKVGDKTATTKIGVYGSAYKVAIVSVPTTIIGNEATEKEVKVAVVDANGNIVANATNSVDLAGSAGLTVVKADGTAYTAGSGIAAKSGVATFHVKAVAGFEGQELTLTAAPVTVADFAATSPNATATLTSYAQVATSVSVTAPTYLPNGDGAKDVSVKVLDQEGKAMLDNSGYWPIKATITGPATLPTSIDAYTGGAAKTFAVTPTVGYTGDVVVTVTIDGIGTKTATLKNVYPTAAAAVKATVKDAKTGTTVNKATNLLQVDFQLVDANGVPVNAAADVALTVTAKDAAGNTVDLTGTAYATTGITGGKATIATGTGTTSITLGADKAGTYTLSFTSGTKSIAAPGAVSLSFNAGDAAIVALNRDNTIVVPVSDPKATVTAQLYDAFGNKVAKSGVELTFTADSSAASINGTATSAKVKTDANGAATATVTTRPYGTYVITVTDATAADNIIGSDATGYVTTDNDVTVSVANQVATKVTVTAYAVDPVTSAAGNKLSSAPAGTSAYLRVTVLDQYGAAMDNQAGVLKLALADKYLANGTTLTDALPAGSALTWSAAASAYVVDNAGTETAVVLGKAGLAALTVKDTAAQTEISGVYNVAVTADKTVASMAAKVLEADSTNTVTLTKGTVSSAYTVQLTDKFGNVLTSAAPVAITFVSSTGLSVRLTADGVPAAGTNVNSTAKFYVAATSDALSGTVEVQIAGTTVYTLNVTTN